MRIRHRALLAGISLPIAAAALAVLPSTAPVYAQADAAAAVTEAVARVQAALGVARSDPAARPQLEEALAALDSALMSAGGALAALEPQIASVRADIMAAHAGGTDPTSAYDRLETLLTGITAAAAAPIPATPAEAPPAAEAAPAPAEQPAAEQPAAPAEEPAAEAPVEQPAAPAEEPAAPAEPQPEAPAEPATPPAEVTPAPETPAPEAPVAETPAPEQPAPQQPAGEAPAAEIPPTPEAPAVEPAPAAQAPAAETPAAQAQPLPTAGALADARQAADAAQAALAQAQANDGDVGAAHRALADALAALIAAAENNVAAAEAAGGASVLPAYDALVAAADREAAAAREAYLHYAGLGGEEGIGAGSRLQDALDRVVAVVERQRAAAETAGDATAVAAAEARLAQAQAAAQAPLPDAQETPAPAAVTPAPGEQLPAPVETEDEPPPVAPEQIEQQREDAAAEREDAAQVFANALAQIQALVTPQPAPTITDAELNARLQAIEQAEQQQQQQQQQAPITQLPPPPELADASGITLLQQGQQVIVRSDDTDRLERGAQSIEVSTLANGWTETIVLRPDGTSVITVRDQMNNLIERRLRLTTGEEVILIDNLPDETETTQPAATIDFAQVLPPIQITIPQQEYVVNLQQATPVQIVTALTAPPVETVERAYTLDEVLNNARLREKMRRIDVDAITFATGSATVEIDQLDAVQQLGLAIEAILRDNPTELFLIEGHTDATGGDLFNLALSDRRAEAVATLLSDYFFIPPENLVTQGYGEQFLKIPTQASERENRRVAVRRITPLLQPAVVAAG